MKILFRDLSFSKKWIITVGGMIGLFIIVIAIALGNLGGIKRSFQRFMNQNYNFTKELKECQIETLSISSIIYETAQQPSMLQKFQTNSQQSKSNITNMISDLKKNYDNTALLQSFESAFNEWYSVLDKFSTAVQTNNNVKSIIDENTNAMKKIMTIAQQIEEEYDEISENVVTKNVNRATRSIITVDILFAITLLLCIVMSRVMRRGVLLPLSEVQKAAEEMEKGNLKTKIGYHSKDEFGQLADSLRNSMETLSVYVTDIDDAMESLSKGDFTIQANRHFIGDFENIENSIAHFIKNMSYTLRKINDVSDELSNSSDKVANGSEELARGATEQASAIEELSTSINGISEQIKNNAQNAKMANDKSNIAGQSVGKSNDKMKEMVIAMSEITQKSTEIEKIIKTINDIAFQTNILALNAAVEAARAGQAGKGFAVVADEVRNLANKTAEAAKDTTTLIAESIKAVENGSGIVDEAAKEMNATLETAGEVIEFIDQIAFASNEQASSIKEITSGMDQISSVIQTNSATSKESANASGELAKEANLLKQLTSNFRLLKVEQSKDKKIDIKDDFTSVKY